MGSGRAGPPNDRPNHLALSDDYLEQAHGRIPRCFAAPKLSSRLERVARHHQGTLFGHYITESLRKTSPVTLLMIWEACEDRRSGQTQLDTTGHDVSSY